MQLRDLEPPLSRAPPPRRSPAASARLSSTLSGSYSQRTSAGSTRNAERSWLGTAEIRETELGEGALGKQEIPIRHFIYPLHNKRVGEDDSRESCVNVLDGGRAVSLRTTFLNKSFSCTRGFAVGYPSKCFYNDTISSAVGADVTEESDNISLCIVQSYDRELGLRFLYTMTEYVLCSVQSSYKNSGDAPGGVLDAFISASLIKERKRIQEPILFHKGDSEELHLFSGDNNEPIEENIMFDKFKESLMTASLAQSSIDNTISVLVRVTEFNVEKDATREWRFYLILLTQDSIEGATQRGALSQCYYDMCQDRFNRRKSTLTNYLEQAFTKGIRYFDVVDLVSPDKALARTNLMLLNSSTTLVEDLTKAYRSLMRKRAKNLIQSSLKDGLLTNDISSMNTTDSALRTSEMLEREIRKNKEMEEELGNEVAFYESDYNSTIENIKNLRRMVQKIDEDIICMKNNIERLKVQEFDITQRLATKRCDEEVLTKSSAMRQMECNRRDMEIYNTQLPRIVNELEETRSEVTRLHNENERLSNKIRAASLIRSTKTMRENTDQDSLSKLQEQVRIKEDNVAKLKASLDNNNTFIMTARKTLEHSRTLMGSFHQYRQSNTGSTFTNPFKNIL